MSALLDGTQAVKLDMSNFMHGNSWESCIAGMIDEVP